MSISDFIKSGLRTVEMEALCMIDMMKQHVIPSAKNTGNLDHIVAELDAGVAKVQAGLDGMHHAIDEHTKAQQARVLRLETMEEARVACDMAEENVPADLWTLATYKELLFLDGHQAGEISYVD